MSDLHWRRERPDKEGYWLGSSGGFVIACIEFFKWNDKSDKLVSAETYLGKDLFVEDYNWEWWAGPIEPPSSSA